MWLAWPNPRDYTYFKSHNVLRYFVLESEGCKMHHMEILSFICTEDVLCFTPCNYLFFSYLRIISIHCPISTTVSLPCALWRTLESSHVTSHVTARKNLSSLGLQSQPWDFHVLPQNGWKAKDAQVTLLVALQRTVLNLPLSYGCKLVGNFKEGTLGWFSRHPNLQSYIESFFRIARDFV